MQRPSPRPIRALATFAVLAVAIAVVPRRAAAQQPGTAPMPAPAEIQDLEVRAFGFEHSLILPGAPAEIWDVLTGDISDWWDHSLSGDPARLVLEPRLGGRFLEVFHDDHDEAATDAADGVVFATVTVVRHPELLRFEGPLGLTGTAVHGVYTYRLEPVGPAGDSTRLTLTTQMVGAMGEQWPAAVEGAWRHFLFERLKPYVEGGL
jgi:hypothetical protein